jgi:PilZ domain-containing protein
MAETATERALQCRNRAEHIRVMAQAVGDRDRREALIKLAGEFDSLANDIERKEKPRRADRRFSDRLRVFKAGKLVFGQGGSDIDCAVRNISRTGALITVQDAVTIPQEFELCWESAVQRCTVVWRNVHGIGVRFDRPMP